jgi:hypothetical protein
LNPAIEGHGCLLEIFGPDERVGEVDEEPRYHEAGEPIIEGHGMLLLEPVAGVGVSDGSDEEAEAERDQDEVQHRALLSRRLALGQRCSEECETLSVDELPRLA